MQSKKSHAFSQNAGNGFNGYSFPTLVSMQTTIQSIGGEKLNFSNLHIGYNADLGHELGSNFLSSNTTYNFQHTGLHVSKGDKAAPAANYGLLM